MTRDSDIVPAMTMTTADLARTFLAEQDRRRGGPAPELCADGYQARIGGAPAVDRDGHEAFAVAFYGAFDGVHHDIEEVFATADRAAIRFVLRGGTHTGSFAGVPPSGRSIKARGTIVLHVEHGKVTRLFGMFDEAGLLRQIG